MNIFTLDISNGLRDHEVGAGEYLLLIDAPPLANVTVKPNSQFGAIGIPLKSGHDVRSRKEVNKWFISADAVAGGTIKILMSDSEEPLTINTVPSDVNVSEIGLLSAFGAAALAQLDKAANPYEPPVRTFFTGNSTALATALSKTLLCDKIRVIMSIGDTAVVNTSEGSGGFFYLNNTLAGTIGGYYDSVGRTSSFNYVCDFDNVKNLPIEFKYKAATSIRAFSFILEEYTLKA